MTAADGAESFYTLANNVVRTETPEQARVLDARTICAWLGHRHMFVIDNSTGFDEKVRRALEAMARVVDVSAPLEKEKKFKILNFTYDMLPKEAVKVEIVQDYLTKVGSMERRVRIWSINNSPIYFYTEKSETGEPGVRIEKERQISLEEYRSYIQQKNPLMQTVLKDRYCFIHAGRNLECDVYRAPLQKLRVVEVELRDMDEQVVFPDSWEVVEVTNDPRFNNYSIAAGLLTDADL